MTSGRDEYLERTKKHIDYEEENARRNWWLNKTGGQASAGLTVRDYFAAKAMQGLLASPRSPNAGNPAADVTDALVADISYKVADAMMKERAK